MPIYTGTSECLRIVVVEVGSTGLCAARDLAARVVARLDFDGPFLRSWLHKLDSCYVPEPIRIRQHAPARPRA
ncbi:hypothetical protein AVO45_00035 [Ruegeria marisrubri]|uniref:Uncharacterized protein n=1 Tax=Ruegeria marisrubri TaxID=1685379 RepID=A0A0X3UC89_9RHOB|nr:hypothetical protein [Ruegeria marisrubri]KUJ85434.1 hypothetical protein AVO45_00035 [Ruegeria marisrubri]